MLAKASTAFFERGAEQLQPLVERLIQLSSFLKWLADNDLTAEYAESTEEEASRLVIFIFSVTSAFSAVNAFRDGD